MDISFDYSLDFYEYSRFTFLIFYSIFVLIVNPIITSIAVKRKFKETSLKLFPHILIIYLLTILISTTPFAVSGLNTYLNEDLDKQTVTNIIKEIKNEERYKVKLLSYHNQNNFLESNWLNLVTSFEIELPEQYNFPDIENFLNRIEFKRNSVIKVYIYLINKDNLKNNNNLYLEYHYNADTKKITSR